MNVRMPDGSIIQAPDGATKAQVLSLYGSQRQAQPAQPASDPEDYGMARGLAREAAGGAAFGWADEGEAVIRAAFTPKSYREELSRIRDEMRAFAQAHPKAAMTANIAGSLATGLPGGARLAAARGASMATKILKPAVASGVAGGISGAGTAEEGDRLGGAAQGTVTGAILGPVTQGVTSAGTGAVRMAQRGLRADQPRGLTKIAEAMQRDRIVDPVAAKTRLSEMGPGATIMDLGDNLTGLGYATGGVPGTGKDTMRNMLSERASGAAGRVLAAANKAFDTVKRPNLARQEINDNLRQVSSTMYAKAEKYAEAHPMRITAKMQDILDTPPGRKAHAIAMENAATEMRELPRVLMRGTDGRFQSKEILDFSAIDDIKKGFDDEIGKAIRAGDKGEVRRMMQVKTKLMEEVDAQNPRYSEARAAWGGFKELENSMDQGIEHMKVTSQRNPNAIDDIKEYLADATPLEKEYYRIGALRSFGARIDDAREGADLGKKIAGSKFEKDRLATILGDDAANDLIKTARTESRFAATRNQIFGGSQTDPRAAARADFERVVSPEDVATAVRDPYSAGTGILRKVLKRSDYDEATRSAIAETLAEQDSTRQNRILDLLAQEEQLINRARTLGSGAGVSGANISQQRNR